MKDSEVSEEREDCEGGGDDDASTVTASTRAAASSTDNKSVLVNEASDYESPSLIHSVKLPIGKATRSVSFSPVCSQDSQIVQGSIVMTLGAIEEWIRVSAFSRDGHMLVSGASEASLRLWDVSRQKWKYRSQCWQHHHRRHVMSPHSHQITQHQQRYQQHQHQIPQPHCLHPHQYHHHSHPRHL